MGFNPGNAMMDYYYILQITSVFSIIINSVFCTFQIHARAEIFGGDRCDPAFRPRFSLFHQWTWLLGVLGGATALYLFLEDYKVGRPVTAKQYPGEGTHYYFCPK